MAEYVAVGYVEPGYYQTGVSIDWTTKVIFIPQFFLNFTGGTVYELDTANFRLALKDLEDSEIGITMPITHNHNTQVLLGGIYYSRIIEIINGYTITFEETGTPYVVNLVGSNNNILDVTNLGTVQVRSNNSAGLINVKELQQNIFGGMVHFSIERGVAGTEYPIGTPLQPVNNIPDAVTIAGIRGFRTIHIMSDLTLDTGDDVSGKTLHGLGSTRTNIIINAGAETLGCEIIDAAVTGNLDGGTVLRDCIIHALNYVNGFIYKCMFGDSLIQLGGVNTANILDCYSGEPGNGPPVIDCNGADGIIDTPLAVRNFSGDLRIIELTNGGIVNINFNSGWLQVDTSCTNGTVIVRGDAKVTDQNGIMLNSGVINGGLNLYNETTTSNSGGLTTAQEAKLDDIWQVNGLDANNPLTVTPTSRVAGAVDQTISGDGTTTSTVTRN